MEGKKLGTAVATYGAGTREEHGTAMEAIVGRVLSANSMYSL